MLDGRKLARMAANRARVRQGRTRTVTLVYRRPDETAYVTAEVVWKPQAYAEPVVSPSLASAVGRAAGQAAQPVAVRAEFPLETDPRPVLLVADTATATPEAVAMAARYEVISYRTSGVAANRWTVELKRLR